MLEQCVFLEVNNVFNCSFLPLSIFIELALYKYTIAVMTAAELFYI